MPAELYEILAQGASYWFAFLGVVIVWRSFAWLRKDGKMRRKRIRQLPDTGYIGELVVISGSDQLRPGVLLPLPREGVLGSYRGCDVTVPAEGVAGKHLTFRFVPGKGLMIEPWVRQEAQVDGQTVTHRGRPGRMYHGSRLQVGEAVLRMRLFMGVETDKMRRRRPTAEVVLPEDWREQTQPHYQTIQEWEPSGDYPEQAYPEPKYFEQNDSEQNYFEEDDAEKASPNGSYSMGPCSGDGYPGPAARQPQDTPGDWQESSVWQEEPGEPLYEEKRRQGLFRRRG